MTRLADRINRLEESATIAMARKSRELKAAGRDIISLSLGEPDFDTPDFIKAAAVTAIDENYTKYMAVNGYEDLRTSICAKFKRDNNLDYTEDQIVVSTGAKQSIANVVMSLINPGDEVIVPAPYWVTYVEIIKMAGGTPVIVHAGIENDFKISADQFRNAITSKSRMMIFSSPCNPTGSVYTEDELGKLADVLADYPELVVISDEIYEHINFTGKHHSIAQFPDIKEQVVTVNGVSKAFAMTGWRLGYIGAPLWIAQACTKLQGQFTSGASGITQRAAKAAVEADPSVTHKMRDAFLKRRNLVLDRLNKIDGVKSNVPPGAFYVFPDVSAFFGKSAHGMSVNNASDVSLYLLETSNVALVTGDAFGDPDCIRISYAASEEVLTEALNRIEKALNELA
ncbi:MAG: pyridoxal phosphate-dependent aminotransferase [Flavobacteriales bacterium]|nr:pyridoxal phosphate-dependent aminotransferase [Flavobacteriales bacterium]